MTFKKGDKVWFKSSGAYAYAYTKGKRVRLEAVVEAPFGLGYRVKVKNAPKGGEHTAVISTDLHKIK